MGRSHVTPIQQPTDTTCGPAALKHALAILGKRKSLEHLISVCKTNRNGTSTKNIISAITKLGYSVLAIEYATLKHLQRSLRHTPNNVRATMVSFLYDLDENNRPHPESGHWAVVSSYSASRGRIAILDSASAMKKSYPWLEFRSRWRDFDLKRRQINDGERTFQLVRRWQPQLLLIIARDPAHLPKFKITTQKLFTPNQSENAG